MLTFQIILSAVIAFGVAWIAYQQYVVNRNRLKLELFEKRFKVYNELMKIFASTLRDRNITNDELYTFALCEKEGAFLYDQNIADYLDEIYKKLIIIQANSRFISKGLNATPQETQKIVDEYYSSLTWIGDEFKNCKIKFDKFLRVDWH